MRFIIIVKVSEEQIKKIVGQIEKQIEVIKAFYHTDDEMIYQETALYKINSAEFVEDLNIQDFIKESNARIIALPVLAKPLSEASSALSRAPGCASRASAARHERLWSSRASSTPQ